jgi:hypothetical protein
MDGSSRNSPTGFRNDPSHEAYMRGKAPSIKAILAELSAGKSVGRIAD